MAIMYLRVGKSLVILQLGELTLSKLILRSYEVHCFSYLGRRLCVLGRG